MTYQHLFTVACERCGGPCGWLDSGDDEMPCGWFCISCQSFTEPDGKEAQHDQRTYPA